MRSGACAVQPLLWTEENITDMTITVESLLGVKGTRLAYSGTRKAGIFKTVIFDSEGKKVWFGDIGIEKAGEALLTLSAKLGPLYLLDQADARFLSKRPTPRFLSHIATVVIESGRILYSPDIAERLGIIKRISRSEEGFRNT